MDRSDDEDIVKVEMQDVYPAGKQPGDFLRCIPHLCSYTRGFCGYLLQSGTLDTSLFIQPRFRFECSSMLTMKMKVQ